MLKTLKITSLVSVIAAGGIVAVLIVFALRGNPEIKAFLGRPGVVERFKDNIDEKADKQDVSSPLVAQARKFALRIDPPPPPKPPAPKNPTPPKDVARANPATRQLPTPKVQVSNKFDLLATVQYDSAPEKSLALLKTTGNKQEWFRQGEMAGNLTISEIRDGSVIFTQGNKELPEVFVPARPQVKSLLKGETPTSRAGPGQVGIELPDTRDESVGAVDARSAARSRTIPSTSQTRPDVSDRIQRIRRIRSVPRPPTPVEQKESLDKTLSGIEEIMTRPAEGQSQEQRQKEKELWMTLMQKIQNEKKNLESQIDTEDASDDTDAESASEDDEPSSPGEPNDSGKNTAGK